MAALRALLEKSTRNWVFRRRMPPGFGCAPIYVSPSCGLRYLFRSIEAADRSLFSLAEEFVHPGSVIWDVGANIGMFTFAAASRAGPTGSVVSIEPDAWLVELLRKTSTIQSGTSAPVAIVPAAAASSVGLRKFCLAKRSRAANYLAGYGMSQAGGSRQQQTVVAVSLDWLLDFYPPPAVLKIDVEGAELEVLQGAIKLFETARPTVLCEVGSTSEPEVTAFFLSRNYQLYDGELPRELRHPSTQARWNTIAVPA